MVFMTGHHGGNYCYYLYDYLLRFTAQSYLVVTMQRSSHRQYKTSTYPVHSPFFMLIFNYCMKHLVWDSLNAFRWNCFSI